MKILKLVKFESYGGVCFDCGKKGDECFCDEDLGSHSFIRNQLTHNTK